MTPAARTFLQSLVSRGVALSITALGTAQEALHYKAPPGTLTKVDLAALRQHKPALLALVEIWDERAAIMEYDGGLLRAEAEQMAWESLEARDVRYKERRMTAPLRCLMTDIDHVGLPNETRTACPAPATLRRHIDTTGPVPRIETDQVCWSHWVQMYCCQCCGDDKGTWRGSFCQPCTQEIPESR